MTSPFSGSRHYAPVETMELRGVVLPARFGDPAAEYEAASRCVALFDRSDRGLLAVAGTDRKRWLHNLVTNAVTTLDDHSGAYAFALDVRGRIQFDLNVFCLPDVLWLDIDAGTIPAARAHLERYLISEDVQLHDASAQFARLGVCGPRAGEVAARLGVSDFSALSALSSRELEGGAVRFVRHDFAGRPGFELVVPRDDGGVWWQRLVQDGGAVPAGWRTLDVLRIEAGIPWLHRDLDDSVLPPETGQTGRAVSYQKGCYLGQEIVERMRSRGALARRLVRLWAPDGGDVRVPAPLFQNEQEVGRLTSLVRHPLVQRWVGLGYLKTRVSELTGISAGDPPRAIHIESP